jgi:DNA-binding CsgD family transcriptional regulator/predicted RNA-binding Zn-ribbon protein involved in translation (DUF1610 family)
MPFRNLLESLDRILFITNEHELTEMVLRSLREVVEGTYSACWCSSDFSSCVSTHSTEDNSIQIHSCSGLEKCPDESLDSLVQAFRKKGSAPALFLTRQGESDSNPQSTSSSCASESENIATIFLCPDPGRVMILNCLRDSPFDPQSVELLTLLMRVLNSLLIGRSINLKRTNTASYGLTPREAEILHWISEGKRNKEIANLLKMSPFTVRNHTENIFQKLKVETRSAAAWLANSQQLQYNNAPRTLEHLQKLMN